MRFLKTNLFKYFYLLFLSFMRTFCTRILCQHRPYMVAQTSPNSRVNDMKSSSKRTYVFWESCTFWTKKINFRLSLHSLKPKKPISCPSKKVWKPFESILTNFTYTVNLSDGREIFCVNKNNGSIHKEHTECVILLRLVLSSLRGHFHLLVKN